METVDPLFRISEHFILADFLGNHSVYSKGFANVFELDADAELRMDNARALCDELLEPILKEWGPFSISYGFISPELSRKIVKYQDPDKPSHHRWDLGAAADVCVHDWTNNDADEYAGSPIAFAHALHASCKPYSRMITYSESPYVCLAASAREIEESTPRQAFYENRYTGQPKVKPEYLQYATSAAKHRAYEQIRTRGLPHGWRGAGYPTHHGGGINQYQHRRVSNYTMVSDWLIDLKSISNGVKNIPSLTNEAVQDAFAAAGMIYDRMIELSGLKRLSIIAGYVSHLNPHFDPSMDWRAGDVHFEVVAPQGVDPGIIADACSEMEEFVIFDCTEHTIQITGEVNGVLETESW